MSSLSTISGTVKLLPLTVPADDEQPDDEQPNDDKPDVAKPIDAESDDAKPIDDKSVDELPFATANDAMVPVGIIKTTVPAVSKGGTA